MAYRKFFYERVSPTWVLYEDCSFLEPFVNLKPDQKKDDAGDDELEPVERLPKSVFDESRLTRLVKERPCLYDKQHEDFRSTNVRKRAWQEIARDSGFDSRTVQKRWRVMRDRFVRELRRAKNSSDVNCSNFFREMLFLTQHVKSKKYEAEANISDNSRDEYDSEIKNERLETCIIADDNVSADSLQVLEATEDSDQVGYTEHGNQFYESYDGQEAYEESSIDAIDNEENLYEEHDLEPESEVLHQSSDQVVAMEEIPEEQWFKSSSSYDSKKRRVLFNEHEEESPPKFIRISATKSPTVSPPKAKSTEVPELNDEDTAFGQTVGLMLKKFPKHLKTSVKLKILQSIADFEIQHNLNQS